MASSQDAVAAAAPRRVPIPPRGVDYRSKVVLAPMVRSGELPSRLLALHYGADLVWGPETVDHSLVGAIRRINPRTKLVEYTRIPTPHAQAHLPPPSSSPDDDASSEAADGNVIYRLDPKLAREKLIFQLGTSDPARAVTAARVVAGDVAGIDVNAGCPKPFSVLGGMGAALLRTPDKLAGILEALVRDIVPEFGIGVSVKIRLLETAAETEALVRRLCATGITGLTVHCRTTPMRPRERAIRGQLRMIADVCREAGVACLMNGDVESRDQAEELVKEFGVDGAMIATAAEKNPSCFRSAKDGGLARWEEVAEKYVRFAMEVENKFNNTKYLLAQMVPGKAPVYRELMKCRSYTQIVEALGYDGGMKQRAKDTDRLQKIGEFEVKQQKKAKGPKPQVKAQNKQESKKRKREDGADEQVRAERKRDDEVAQQVPATAAVAAAPVAV
ncbi:FMN-linked oxidoreductase [Canariomyces notabilis]|uniref:FMN-linked oxidoreductase n=1 Tax=Canariomyces notabilis TaxID=2074819 RepID=A0AAN6YWS3_9PEZI|nr:FMN-linked oxidoreductase [Canariomyces arenarius]